MQCQVNKKVAYNFVTQITMGSKYNGKKTYEIHHKTNVLQHAGALEVYFSRRSVWGVPKIVVITLQCGTSYPV